MQIQLQNPRTGNWESVNISAVSEQQLRGPQPAPTVVHVQQPRSSNGHPLLILGVVIGALFGLIACLPPKIRGWVVLGLIAGVIWLCWRANTDHAQAYAGSNEPVAAEHHPYSVLEHNPDARIENADGQLSSAHRVMNGKDYYNFDGVWETKIDGVWVTYAPRAELVHK